MSKKRPTKNDWTRQDDRLSNEISKRRLERVRSLVLKDHVSSTKLNPRTGTTALHQAAIDDDVAVLNILLDCKDVDLNARDLHGRTLLHRAACGGVHATARLLQCQPVPDVSAVDHNGLSVLHHACIGNHLDCAKLLLEQHAPVFVKDKNGRSALSYAAERGQASICRLLLQHGADIDDKDNFNRTALMMAAEAGHLAVCDYLIRQGADITVANSRGWDALYIAAKGNKTEVVKILERATRELAVETKSQQIPAKKLTNLTSHGENEYEEMPNDSEVTHLVKRAAGGSFKTANKTSPAIPAAAAAVRGNSVKNSSASIKSRERIPTPDSDFDETHHTYNVLTAESSTERQPATRKIAAFKTVSADGVLSTTNVGQSDESAKLDVERRGISDEELNKRQLLSLRVADVQLPDWQRTASEICISDNTSHLSVARRFCMANPSSARSEPSLALKEVEVSEQDVVELLPQIIHELETEKAAMDVELENVRSEKRIIEQSKFELDKKYSLIVNSHQWLLEELGQILKLVGNFRRELTATTSAAASGQKQLARTNDDGLVDSGLQQIERLIGALVHIDHQVHFIEEVDVYGCYTNDVDKLVSQASRMQRGNQTLQYELRQAVLENAGLRRQVDDLEKVADTAGRLQEENDEMRLECDQLVSDVRNFKERVKRVAKITSSGPIQLEDLEKLFEKSANENAQLNETINELLVKVEGLQSAIKFADKSSGEMEAERLRRFEEQLGEMRQRCKSKENENEWLKENASQLLNKMTSLESELASFRDSTSEMELALSAAIREKTTLADDKELLSEKLRRASVDSSGKDAAMKKLGEKNTELMQSNDALKLKLSERDERASKALNELKNLLAEKKKLDEERVNMCLEKKRLEDQLEEMHEAVGRQSQVILELDEKLRESRALESKRLSNEVEIRPQVDVRSSKHDREANGTAVDDEKVGEEAVSKLEAELNAARCKLEEQTTAMKHLEESSSEKTAEILKLQWEITDCERRISSEKEYFKRKLEILHKDHSAQFRQLNEENASFKKELDKLRRDEARHSEQPLLAGVDSVSVNTKLRSSEELVRRPVENTRITSLCPAQQDTIRDRTTQGFVANVQSSLSGIDRDGSDVEQVGSVERYERQLASDLAMAVDASRTLLEENQRLRQEIDRLTKLRHRRSRTEDNYSTYQAEFENEQLKHYVEELEDKVSALKKTVDKQGIYLENYADGKSSGDISNEHWMMVDGGDCRSGVVRAKVSKRNDSIELVNQVTEENRRTKDELSRLKIELDVTVKEVEAKQAIIRGLESFLVKTKSDMEKMELALQTANESVKSFETVAADADDIMVGFADGVAPAGQADRSALHQLQELVKTFKKIDVERNNLAQRVTVLRERNEKFERDSHLITSMTQTMGKMRSRLKDLERELVEVKKEHSTKTGSSNLVDGTKTCLAPTDRGSTKFSPADADALVAENEVLRLLIKSIAIQLEPDVEEHLMAEVERLTSSTELRHRYLVAERYPEMCVVDKTSDVTFSRVDHVETSDDRKLMAGDERTPLVAGWHVVSGLRAEITRLRDENDRLRQRDRVVEQPKRSTTESNRFDNKITSSFEESRVAEGKGDENLDTDSFVFGLEHDERSGSGFVRRTSSSTSEQALSPKAALVRDSIHRRRNRKQHHHHHADDDDDSDDLRQLCRQLELENEALREKITSAWKVSVQHAISRNVSVQTTAIMDDVIDTYTNMGGRVASSGEGDGNVMYFNATNIQPTTGGDERCLDNGQLVKEIRRLRKLLAETEKSNKHTVQTYRRHLLESIQGRIDPSVKEALLQIVHSPPQPRNDDT